MSISVDQGDNPVALIRPGGNVVFVDDQYTGKDKELKISGKHEIVPLPSDHRECIYVFGPSGSGKTRWCNEYAKLWMKMYPGKHIYVFSRLTSDPSLTVPVHRIDLEQLKEIDEAGILELEEMLEDSLIIFDDTDSIKDKRVHKIIAEVRDKLLETGRHDNTYMLITSHLSTHGLDSRDILNECSKYVMFPTGSTDHNIEYLLKQYLGFKTKDMDFINHINSRWVMLYKNRPRYLLSSDELLIL